MKSKQRISLILGSLELNDMTYAINLQVLITALAYKYIIDGTITHQSIPDNPSIESERRQIIFGFLRRMPECLQGL